MKIFLIRLVITFLSVVLFYNSIDCFINKEISSSLFYAAFGFFIISGFMSPSMYLTKITKKNFFSIQQKIVDYNFSDFMDVIGNFFLILGIIFYILEKFNFMN